MGLSGTDPALTVATLGVVLAMGGTATEADAVMTHLYGQVPPSSASGCAEMIEQALAAVRAAG